MSLSAYFRNRTCENVPLKAFVLAAVIGAGTTSVAANDQNDNTFLPPASPSLFECPLGNENEAGYMVRHIVNIFDRTRSIDFEEFQTQLYAVAQAIRHDDFIDAIEQIGPVAISNGTFSSYNRAYNVLPTFYIWDRESAYEVSDLLFDSIGLMQEQEHGSGTSLRLALQTGQRIASACEPVLNPDLSPFAHEVRINVISDMEHGYFPPVRIERDRILEIAREGATFPHMSVSGIALINSEAEAPQAVEDMTTYVVGGTQRFYMTILAQDSIGGAFRRKLVWDISQNLMQGDPLPDGVSATFTQPYTTPG
mgnify:CR=1 FL=1